MRNLNLFLMIIIIGLFIAGTVLFVNLKNIESQISASLAQLKPLSQKEKNYLLEDFVNCLTKRGVKLYGIASEKDTQEQKIIFKEAREYLPYIECQEPETKQLTFECQLANIQTFPTWEFPNGEKVIGKISLEKLAELSGCSLENFNY